MLYRYDPTALRRAVQEAGGVLEAARQTGLSYQVIATWCRRPGAAAPTARLLARLASGLRCHPGTFFRTTGRN